MVAMNFQRSFAALALTLAGMIGMSAAPASANSSAATADVTSSVRAAQGDTLSGGDEKFKDYFARWEALDGGDASAPAPTSSVSVPSRMPLNNASLTSKYGMRTHPVIGGRRAHKGVDLAAPTGTPIYATADGIVSKAERFSSYGLYVSIEHGAQLQTRFAHMSRIAVANGAHVKKGDIIGYVGSTGRSTGPHLHYEVRIAGKAVNPIPYMVESTAQQAFAKVSGQGGRGGQ